MTARAERLDRLDLVRLLGETIGDNKAQAAIDEAARTVGATGAAYDRNTTLRMLEFLAEQPGLVGIVARFAKVRIILQFK